MSISIVVIVVCVLVNTSLGIFFLYSRPIMGSGFSKDRSAQLVHRSTYIGLDRLYSNTTAMKKYPPLQTQATRFFHISSAQPTMQLALESPKVLIPGGSMPAAHGFYQLLVTPEVTNTLISVSFPTLMEITRYRRSSNFERRTTEWRIVA